MVSRDGVRRGSRRGLGGRWGVGDGVVGRVVGGGGVVGGGEG